MRAGKHLKKGAGRFPPTPQKKTKKKKNCARKTKETLVLAQHTPFVHSPLCVIVMSSRRRSPSFSAALIPLLRLASLFRREVSFPPSRYASLSLSSLLPPPLSLSPLLFFFFKMLRRRDSTINGINLHFPISVDVLFPLPSSLLLSSLFLLIPFLAFR